MYNVCPQGVDERMINVHYYYYIIYTVSPSFLCTTRHRFAFGFNLYFTYLFVHFHRSHLSIHNPHSSLRKTNKQKTTTTTTKTTTTTTTTTTKKKRKIERKKKKKRYNPFLQSKGVGRLQCTHTLFNSMLL